MSQLHVELVAADRLVWEGDASQVSARSTEGELGILPGHTPLLGIMVEGDVRIHRPQGLGTAHIDSGFLSVHDNVVTIVVESAETSNLD